MTTEGKLIKNKLGLLELATYLKNVSEACRVIGFSRDTFYRVKKADEEGGVEGPNPHLLCSRAQHQVTIMASFLRRRDALTIRNRTCQQIRFS